ncbi:MAG: PqqD family protein, partial [Planctomycetes bacterium]|nr:PqqD family protein [Planctomycetota bacterium]
MGRDLSEKAVVVRRIPWLEDDAGVVLLPPYFGMTLIGRILQSLFRYPTKRFRLDDLGGHIWKLCDGATSIEKIIKT